MHYYPKASFDSNSKNEECDDKPTDCVTKHISSKDSFSTQLPVSDVKLTHKEHCSSYSLTGCSYRLPQTSVREDSGSTSFSKRPTQGHAGSAVPFYKVGTEAQDQEGTSALVFENSKVAQSQVDVDPPAHVSISRGRQPCHSFPWSSPSVAGPQVSIATHTPFYRPSIIQPPANPKHAKLSKTPSVPILSNASAWHSRSVNFNVPSLRAEANLDSNILPAAYRSHQLLTFNHFDQMVAHV